MAGYTSAASARRGRGDRFQRQVVARTSRRFCRIDKTIPAHPDGIRRLGQIGNQEPAVVVRHDDLPEQRLQVIRFGDDPDPCLGAGRASHDPGDRVLARRNRRNGKPDGSSSRERDRAQQFHETMRATHRFPLCSVRWPPSASTAPRNSYADAETIPILVHCATNRSTTSRRGIPPGGVAPRSNTACMLPRRAWPAGRRAMNLWNLLVAQCTSSCFSVKYCRHFLSARLVGAGRGIDHVGSRYDAGLSPRDCYGASGSGRS